MIALHKLYIMSSLCLITIFTKTGQPLKCWYCSTVLDSGCDDPFKPEDLSTGTKFFLEECGGRDILNGSLEEQHIMDHVFGPGAREYCYKTVRQMYGITFVHRGCGLGHIGNHCLESEHEDCTIETCFEDGCNAAPRLGLSLLFVPLLMLCSSLF